MSIETEKRDATADRDREDRFTFDVCAFDLHFPCVVCIHREKKPDEVCYSCNYYFN